MKTAIIAPDKLLGEYATTDYHLTLIAELMKRDEYHHFYITRPPQHFIIIDNSAHEFGSSRHAEKMIEMAAEISANEVVLPERMFWGEDTIDMASKFMPVFRDELLPGTTIMGVPQGRTIEEWDWCCTEHLRMGVDTIGISKDFEVWPGGLVGRVQTVRQLARRAKTKVEIHLLGWGRNLWELTYLHEIERHAWAPIRGIDSAKPLVYAAAGLWLPMDFEGPYPEYPRRPDDFFQLETIDWPCATNNIASYLRSAGVEIDAVV